MKRRHRIFSAVIAIILALTMLGSIIVTIVTSLSANAVTEAEIEALKAAAEKLADEKAAVGKELYALREEKDAIIERKVKLDENIALTIKEIENLDLQIQVYEEEIEEKISQYELAVSEEERQVDLFRQRIRAMEEDGDISYMEIIFEADSFADLLSVMDSVTDIMDYDEWVVEQLDSAQEATWGAKVELENAKAEAEAAKIRQQEKQAQLEAERAEADALMTEIMNNMEERQSEYNALEAREDEAADEIDRLVEELEEERRRLAAQQGAHVAATGSYIWPSASSVYVTSLFGNRLHPVYGYYRTHYGIDIGASYGTNILAADGGYVVTSTYGSGYGNYVMIDHGEGRYTLYAHMTTRYVNEGDVVLQGDVIGIVGSTGVSTGPHIHFEVYDGGERIDPLQFFTNYVIV
ncbi:MAG: peptidoglycan DD-metalloendopeptidase family protein [Oscillospiraceae bacterium]|nr:peptidoglycan DD-metalloendopeptidase family protein [Oscillospiraceae bacterium]